MGETFKNHKNPAIEFIGGMVWIKEILCVNFCVNNDENTIH